MSNTDQPVTSKSVVKRLQAQGAEPVATLPACLCGLDTNPVASPRMDIHCPKHDTPEGGSEPSVPTWRELRELLNRYALPCLGDCEHSQCPLLKELWLMMEKERIKEVLDEAKKTVQPIVDAEKKGEDIGDIMEMRLRTAPPSPTPADEEVARAPNDLIAWKWAQTLSEDEQRVLLSGNVKRLQTMITTALAEARRAGTPTTEAAFEDWLNREDYGDREQLQRCWNAAMRHASALSSTLSEQKHVDYVFDGMNCCKVCGLVRPASGWKKPCSGKTPELSLRSTPSDEVAQRARAAAEEIADSLSHYNRYMVVPLIEQVITKHFTATDVERKDNEQ